MIGEPCLLCFSSDIRLQRLVGFFTIGAVVDDGFKALRADFVNLLRLDLTIKNSIFGMLCFLIKLALIIHVFTDYDKYIYWVNCLTACCLLKNTLPVNF